ncbi:MAG: DUF554 domain-containing protein [Clostridia bacterium]|nr:DUF554 domain-containing protein [Clostridia bacterium]
MPFLGTLINAASIVLFSLLGALVKHGVPERLNRAILNAVAIAVIYIGLDSALESPEGYLTTFFSDAGLTKFIIIIISLAVGTLIGELIDIDKWVNRLGARLEAKFAPKTGTSGASGGFAEGFINCTIMTCVGAMAVYGSMLDASGEPATLIAKSVIDAISCFIMAASFGIGCAFSALPMLLYQGAITVLTLLLKSALADSLIFDACIYYLSGTGSLILVLIGLNFLGATKVKTANMTPSVFIPFILVPILSLF